MKTDSCSAQRGRPRAFDADAALESAMRIFWEKGYEGASLTDLTEAMGINRPSLYAAFGNKEELFSKVLDRYTCSNMPHFEGALALPTARAGIEQILRHAVARQAVAGTPTGCLGVQTALACGEEGEQVKQRLIEFRRATECKLRQRLERAQVEGEKLPGGVEPADLARFFSAVLNGLSVQSATGYCCTELSRVVDIAMTAWPTE